MLQLCGLPLSNYYNKVKLVLLDHEIDFEEQIHTLPLSGDEALDASPFGKVPFLRTEHGALSESQAIVEYLAARYPEKGLFPADPFEAAKVREITVFVELYLEWVARSLYGQAFFGGTASEETQRRVEKRLVGALAAFRKMTRFAPYVLGETYGMADVAAYIHLPIVGARDQGRVWPRSGGRGGNRLEGVFEAGGRASRRAARDGRSQGLSRGERRQALGQGGCAG